MTDVIVLTIVLIVSDIILGTQAIGFGLFIVYQIVFALSSIIGTIVTIRLILFYKNKNKKLSPFLFLLIVLIPIYFVTSIIITLLTSSIALQRFNEESYLRISADERRQNYNSVKRGQISHVGKKLVYECVACNYRLSIPDTWGYEEQNASSTYVAGYVDTFRVTTDDFIHRYSSHPRGGTYFLESTKDPDLWVKLINRLYPETQPKQLNIDKFSLMFIEGDQGLTSGDQDGGYFAWFSYGDYHYLIHAHAATFEEFKNGLIQIFSEFSFLNGYY